MNPDAIAQIYASDIVSGFDIYKPEKQNVLFARYGDQGASFFQLLRSLGFETEVSLDTYGHYEENRTHEVVRVDANTTAGTPGLAETLTMTSDSLDANNNYYLRQWDMILFPNEVVGIVESIEASTPTAPTFEVTPVDVTEIIPTVAQDDELVIMSNAFSEGSGQPLGAIRGTYEYDNDAQIIKETIGATGSEMVNQTWFAVNTFGQKTNAYYHLGQVDLDYRMALRVDGALLWGKRTSNTTPLVDPITGRVIKSTEGLIPYIRRMGNEQTYTDGNFDVAEFDEMDNTLDREFAGNYIMGLLGLDLHQQIENALVTYFANTNIIFAKETVNEVLFNRNESLGASVNFKYLTKSERTFLMKRMGVFNNPKLYGATGYPMPKFGVFMPINRRKDPVSGNMVESIGCRYRGLGRYNRRMEVWSTGGAGEGLKVNDIDARNWYQRCHIGAHYRGINQFVLLEPA
jgi:hypothetical protein